MTTSSPCSRPREHGTRVDMDEIDARQGRQEFPDLCVVIADMFGV
jgi:hypothetical protein